MKLSPQTSSQARLAGLSLVECLAILVVIAVLIALLLPPPGGLRENGGKSHASSDETQIVTAVKAYYVEYGKYPVPSTMPRGTYYFSSDNNVLFDVLCNRSGTKSGNPLNSRGIVFLDIPLAKDQTHPKDGIQTSTGIWFDPWGSPYHIAIDGAGSGQLNGKVPIPGFYSDVGLLPLGMIVWSYGKNGALGGGPAASSGFSNESGTPGKYKGSGDVISW